MALREPGDRAAALAEAATRASRQAPHATPDPGFPVRLERFDVVSSTNDVVSGWLRAGEREVCVAVADVQREGRGRLGRRWEAPPGAALLASVGFRPTWLVPERAWRLAGVVALAMADAAEDAAGLGEGTIRLKWPNDLVVGFRPTGGPIGGASSIDPGRDVEIRKLAGLLGETDGLGTPDPRVVVGIGINVDWARSDFPPELARDMTSLREVSGGRPVDRDELLEGFVARLETRVEALRGGYFDVAGWTGRQLTSGRMVRLERPDGSTETVRAVSVDATSGALLVAGSELGTPERQVLAGEIRHVRVGPRV